MFKEILEKIKEFDTIIIHRHLRPDGDCIGSQFGLKYLIEDNFPEKKVYAVGDQIPDYLSFIGKNDEINADIYSESLVSMICLEIAYISSRLNFVINSSIKLLKIIL